MTSMSDFDDHSVVVVPGHRLVFLPLGRPALPRPAPPARFTGLPARRRRVLLLHMVPVPMWAFEDPAHDVRSLPDLLRDFGAEDPMEPDTPTIQPINI